MIDAAAIGKIDKSLEEELRGQATVTLLRFADVSYINSSGMGLLIKYSDLYRAAARDLVLVEISPKVLALFRMLGLLSVLKSYPNQAQAVAALRAGGAKAPEAPPAPKPAAAASAPAASSEGAIRFPLLIPCHGCSVRLTIPEPGFYRCPGCSCCYEAAEGKPLRSFPSERRAPVEATLSYDAGLLDGICAVASRVAESAGFSEGERSGLVGAFRGLLQGLIGRANGKGRILKVLIASDPGECLIGVRADVPWSGAGDDPALAPIRSAVDRLEVTGGQGGIFFKLRKRSAAAPKTPQTP